MSGRARSNTERFEAAERELLTACGLDVQSRRLGLADPPLTVRVLEAGVGPPLVLVHGSGMSAATWAPLMPHLEGHRLIALDLPGFGLSDAYDYSGRSLRDHAVAQLTSLLDALEIERAAVVGTSLGAMWGLCFAVDAPGRITALASLGVPAVALRGMRGDPFFAALSTPGLRQLAAECGRLASRSHADRFPGVSSDPMPREGPRMASLPWSTRACADRRSAKPC